jgi:hypothetical protein
VGRLENIIERNRRPPRRQERLMVSLGFGALVLLLLGLMVFTDLGLPPEASRPSTSPPAGARARDGRHVDGVLLRSQPAATPAQR